MFLEMMALDSQFENCFAWVLSIDYSNALNQKDITQRQEINLYHGIWLHRRFSRLCQEFSSRIFSSLSIRVLRSEICSIIIEYWPSLIG